MRLGAKILWLLGLSCVLACKLSYASEAKPDVVYKGVEFTQLSDTVWMHTSYKTVGKWGNVPANGLIVVEGENTTLIDTAWDNAQTEAVLEWVQKHLKRSITRAVFTHAHEDKMGGVQTLHAQGIQTWASALSNQLAPSRGLLPANSELTFNQHGISDDLSPSQVLYPGAGHTHDNIVVYLPETKILYGGCLIRPGNAKSMGNTRDGDVNTWAPSVDKVALTFPDAEMVIPTHSQPGDRQLLSHTIELARKHSASRQKGPK
ncbi:subclass B1 metallo-beta-lactamase [Pseudoteredinibacter isoporae]|uniref:subclass B1 metallo-beta-lactamase n=1 Tax=Pseudoteredinibacter isoporae TaxID=570281 RepID=UPI00310AFE35